MSVLNNLQLQLFTATNASLSPTFWNTYDNRSTFWRFYYHHEDGAWLSSAGETFPLHSGQVYFVPAGVCFDTHCAHTVRQFYVHFDVIGLPSIVLQELFNRPLQVPGTPALQETVRVLSDSIDARSPAGLPLECRVKGVIFEGLARYMDTVPRDEMDRCWQAAEELAPVLPAIRYIEAQPDAHLSIQTLAELCCINSDYFIRRFRACTGKTPGQYIQEHRVKIAAQRLVFSDRSIDQIAAETGFGNRNYFTRIFTRHTGLPPAAYRKAKGTI